jgi:tetratricopeptide (TPR) repeat protein
MTRAQLGALEEGAAQLAGAIAALEATAVEAADRSLLALVDLWYGWVTFLLARNAEAEAAAARALARYAADDDRWGVARCQYLLGNSYTARGELLAAVAPLVASRATADELGDRRGAGMARRNLCILAGWFGRYDEARAHIGVAAEVSEELDDRLGLAYARRELGKLLVAEGRYADAVATLEASIAVTDDIENRWESAATADDLGNALAAGGDVDAAERALVACRRAAEESSNRYYVARATGDLGALALRRGDRDRAEWFLTAARAQWRDFGHEPYAAWVEVQLGHLAGLDPGGRDAAGSRYAASLTLAVRHGLAPFAMDALVGAAALGLLDGAGARAGALHLAASHPATTHEVRERARSVLADDAAAPGAEPASADVDTPDAWRAVAVAVAERLAR